MAVNSSWDVQKYRSRFEPTCHWKLKEEFMLAHQQHIEEEQLVCLANVSRPLHKFFRRQDRAATLILQSMAMNQNGSVGCGYQVKCVRHHIAYVNNVEVARRPFRSHENKSVALEMLARDALVIMSKYCPLLLQKKRSCETNVESDDLIGKKIGKNSGESEPQLDEDEQSALSRPISSSNVGSRLLQLMGWTGGGLGKNETGRVDPVEAAMRHGRSGLGFKDSISQMATKPIFKAKIENLLRQFKREFEAGCAEREELVFPSVFSKDQRALVHSVAQRLSLKSVSYGSGEARYLVVKPMITHQCRVQQILENGGENELYKVYPAGTYDLSVLDLLD
ncbi:hypothetical protein HAZT_HAZT010173 [Hyalella azteca]|uniref:G-patch domain-containing protein n=1 Tax=Hyalella azteca TaxID=294128 RepID=A0A6A0H3N0_HYAAZ|nr:hypothetical protein HAZT_HAZT010173 [Hyalella azteca]